jgi:serine/threonine protein kinase
LIVAFVTQHFRVFLLQSEQHLPVVAQHHDERLEKKPSTDKTHKTRNTNLPDKKNSSTQKKKKKKKRRKKEKLTKTALSAARCPACKLRQTFLPRPHGQDPPHRRLLALGKQQSDWRPTSEIQQVPDWHQKRELLGKFNFFFFFFCFLFVVPGGGGAADAAAPRPAGAGPPGRGGAGACAGAPGGGGTFFKGALAGDDIEWDTLLQLTQKQSSKCGENNLTLANKNRKYKKKKKKKKNNFASFGNKTSQLAKMEKEFALSRPSNFQHRAHLGRDGARVQESFKIETLPDEYVDLFLQAGMSPEEMADPKVIEFALNFVLENVSRFPKDEFVKHVDLALLQKTVHQFRAERRKTGSKRHDVSLRLQQEDLDFGPVEKMLGRGATCEVLEATFFGTQVAVKRLLHAHDGANLPVLEREVAILTRLRHPNVVQCLGALLSVGQRPCIVLELLEGGCLADALYKARPTLSEGSKMELMRQLAAALTYLHSRQPAVVHRDCKPQNVLLDRERKTAKLTDFGISHLAQTQLSTQTVNVGTPAYTAPEVFDPPPGASEPTKLDVYSFAMTLWETLAGQPPFSDCASPMQIMFIVAKGIRPDVKALRCSVAVRTLLSRCWAKEPAERPTMREVLDMLDPVAAEAVAQAQEEATAELLCVVCLEREKSHILIPCGHLCVCEKDSHLPTCPLCRAAVSNSYRVFK